mmetsp:Transcript_62535/g.118309  ORF Transcript_62535/g.118309 Transcript_62535/m.118309 type:complete len:602 (-) Transcript_62535:52-1857(-)
MRCTAFWIVTCAIGCPAAPLPSSGEFAERIGSSDLSSSKTKQQCSSAQQSQYDATVLLQGRIRTEQVSEYDLHEKLEQSRAAVQANAGNAMTMLASPLRNLKSSMLSFKTGISALHQIAGRHRSRAGAGLLVSVVLCTMFMVGCWIGVAMLTNTDERKMYPSTNAMMGRPQIERAAPPQLTPGLPQRSPGSTGGAHSLVASSRAMPPGPRPSPRLAFSNQALQSPTLPSLSSLGQSPGLDSASSYQQFGSPVSFRVAQQENPPMMVRKLNTHHSDSPSTDTRSLQGSWRQKDIVHTISGSQLYWNSTAVTEITLQDAETFRITLDGGEHQAQLSSDGLKLLWSDGDVWFRTSEERETINKDNRTSLVDRYDALDFLGNKGNRDSLVDRYNALDFLGKSPTSRTRVPQAQPGPITGAKRMPPPLDPFSVHPKFEARFGVPMLEMAELSSQGEMNIVGLFGKVLLCAAVRKVGERRSLEISIPEYGSVPRATVGPSVDNVNYAHNSALEIRGLKGQFYGMLVLRFSRACYVTKDGETVLTIDGDVEGLQMSIKSGGGLPLASVRYSTELFGDGDHLEIRVEPGVDTVLVLACVLSLLLLSPIS